jgi:hypothetical protein
MVEWSKERVCGRSLADIVGCNHSWGTLSLSVVRFVCCLRRADPLSRRVRYFVWSRNLSNEAALARVWLSRQINIYTRWFKYDRDWLCVNKSQFVPVIFEPPCTCICMCLCRWMVYRGIRDVTAESCPTHSAIYVCAASVCYCVRWTLKRITDILHSKTSQKELLKF